MHRIIQTIVGVVLGLIFYEAGTQLDDAGISATVASVFTNSLFCAFMTIMILPTMINDRAVIMRERSSGLYRTLPFAVSIFVSGVIVTLITAVVVSAITFYMIGFQNAFDRYFFGIWTTFFFVEVVVILVSIVISHHVIGIIVVIAYVACGVMVEGYFMTFDRISWAVRWIGYVTPQRFVWRALVRNEFEGRENFTKAILYPNGEAVINFYFPPGDGIESYWAEIGISWVFLLVNMLILMIVLARKF